MELAVQEETIYSPERGILRLSLVLMWSAVWHILRLANACAIAGRSMEAAAQGGSPAPAAEPAAPDLAQLHGSLDLLGEVQQTSPAPSAIPNIAASSGALHAQSDDSLVALGQGEQGKSLSLSGWNSESRIVQDTSMIGSSARPDAQIAQVTQLTLCAVLSDALTALARSAG